MAKYSLRVIPGTIYYTLNETYAPVLVRNKTAQDRKKNNVGRATPPAIANKNRNNIDWFSIVSCRGSEA